jgi:L-ribulose-5-phosphate 3-epimerase
MQGRLSPPVDGQLQAFPAGSWREEFAAAAAAGLDGIEWIYDATAAESNPIAREGGVAEILDRAHSTGIRVSSVCADWFMAYPFGRGTAAEGAERRERLSWLIGRAALVAADHVVVPFVDNSSLSGDELERVAAELEAVAAEAERHGVAIHLETDLAPREYASFLEQLAHSSIQVTYDVGNSAALGHDPEEELAAYGDRIGSVHVKDRLRDGGSVPLGEGAASFELVFEGLNRCGYAGWFVLQPARGRTGDEVAWIRRSRELVERAWKDAA